MKKKIVIFEAEGGNDKGLDGHRKDTMPIVHALKEKGWDAEVIFFRDEWKHEIINYCKDKFDGYIGRVNPGNLANGEKIYFDTLKELSQHGLIGMPNPDEMIQYGAKDSLVKLAQTELVPSDTFAYNTIEELKENFPKTLKTGTRVLKQNRGSTGSGIWKVSTVDENNGADLHGDTKIKIVEALDNHSEYTTLGDFMNFCEQYTLGENGVIVDMKFLPRIKEGEIRILYVGENPIFVIHKKPANTEDSFSATLFSGAKYNYQQPEEYRELINLFSKNLPNIKHILGNIKTPLIWTADFILDTDENGKDKYILGEINCSCVGFTNHLNEGIQEKIANEVIKIISNEKK